MKTLRLIVPILILLVLTACSKKDQDYHLQKDLASTTCNSGSEVSKLKIAVLSDLHFMEPSLLKEDGSAFQSYLMQDPKLLKESRAILKQIIQNLIIEKPDLVLITGDLTKDGELIGHKALIKQLKVLEMNHIKILVVPGNHDINNPDAKQFVGDNTLPVTTITPDEFASLYSDFGYRNPVSSDPSSLSYVAEPFEGLRILALDANEYYNNTPDYCVVAGNLKDETMEWAKEQLADAKEKGITVIGMMHHGIVEHFMGESVIFPDYLVDKREARADALMQAGLKVIFTGHFHANDASLTGSGQATLVDVETGSPVIFYSPCRITNLIDKKLYITTKHIEHIGFPLRGVSFYDYEKAFSLNGFGFQAAYMLMNPPYNVPEEMAAQLAPAFGDAMLAHFAGDETISAETYGVIQAISDISPDLANILLGLYSDLPPSDNDLVIDLN